MPNSKVLITKLICTAVVIALLESIILIEEVLPIPAQLVLIITALQHVPRECESTPHLLMELGVQSAVPPKNSAKKEFGLEDCVDRLCSFLSFNLNIVDILIKCLDHSLSSYEMEKFLN